MWNFYVKFPRDYVEPECRNVDVLSGFPKLQAWIAAYK